MEEKRFGERITDEISGPPKKRVTITFPEEVFANFDKYAKDNSADCYWLAIKQLIDFYIEQKEGDLKTVMIMQTIQELKTDIEAIQDKLHKIENQKEENFQTFGTKEE